MAEKNKPVFKVRAGNISASIFKNKIKGKDGKSDFEMDSISLQKSFTKDEGKTWENQSISMRKSDIMKLFVVANKLAEYMYLNSEDKEES